MQNSFEAKSKETDQSSDNIFTAPGIYLSQNFVGKKKGHTFGTYNIHINGRLSSYASKSGWTLFFDGIYLDSFDHKLNDAERALDLFLDKGVEAVQNKNGFFNVLLINENGTSVHFLSDVLSSRPWYVYQQNNTISVAPTPTYFADIDLEMSLNAQALYEQIRLLHTGYDRTLIEQIQRVLPGFSYTIETNQTLKKERIFSFDQLVDSSLTLDECSEYIKDLNAEVIKGVLNHPLLKDFKVQLPLTGGLDSRHLLAELLEQKAEIDQLQHILIQKKDFDPVTKIADSLNLPLNFRSLDQLDTKNLLSRWTSRTGGLSNIHQYYLLNLKNTNSDESRISFNGYLMDLLMGMSVKTDKLNSDNPYKAVWNRTYSSPSIRKLLIPDSKKHEKATEALIKEQVSAFKGEGWFKMLMLDLHNRGLHYTGNIDAMLEEEVYSFSPAASLSVYQYAAKAPHSVAGDKKARLHSLQKYFPEIASFPGVEGIPFSEMKIRAEIIESPILKNLKSLFKSIKSGFKKDHAPESEHSWIRKNEDLNTIHHNAILNSELVNDGHINSMGLKLSWRLNEMGGYQGWTLMSFLSAEVAYRLLVKKQSQTEVLNLLFEK